MPNGSKSFIFIVLFPILFLTLSLTNLPWSSDITGTHSLVYVFLIFILPFMILQQFDMDDSTINME